MVVVMVMEGQEPDGSGVSCGGMGGRMVEAQQLLVSPATEKQAHNSSINNICTSIYIILKK